MRVAPGGRPGVTRRSPEQVAELQQLRLDAMIELGIREECHPDVE